MSEPLIVLCPGQGAQAVGMGKAWADASAEARSIFERADALLGDRLGAPLSTLCFEGPAETLNRTDVSQPAIFTTSIACWRGLSAQQGWSVNEAPLAACAGLSLGEYTALAIAGAISFEDGLELVALRGAAMQRAAQASAGSMVALIGADEDKANALCDKAKGPDVLVCANFNAPGQIVLSGSAASCQRAVALAGEVGVKATPLTVAGAFHSPLMQPAADALAAALAKVKISAPRCPVLSNVTAKPHIGPDAIRRALVEQLTNPVRWSQCCQFLTANAKGAYHELAPGKVLSGLMRRIDKAVAVTAHEAP